jgi:quercetin dioxygenase-like cupin family protein
MKLETHRDKRGTIKDLMVGKDFSITYITFKKGAVRGNHVHKETYQKDIILSGKVLFKTDAPMTRNEVIYKKGEICEIPPTYPHAYKALGDSEMISICFGKRIGSNYSKDTYALQEPLIKPSK